MKLLLVGSRDFSKHILRHLVKKWEVVGVVAPESTSQAGHEPFDDICAQNDINLIRTSDINTEKAEISKLSPDLGVCAGWTQIISEKILEIPERGFLGLHSSKLPEGRGGAPVNWSIINGENAVGLSLFEFVPEVDAGDIVEQSEVKIEQRDNIETVYDKLTVLAFDLLDEALPKIKTGDEERTTQSNENATYFPNRKPKDGLIDWDASAKELHDWIRALTHPYPGAFSFHEGKKIKIWEAEIHTNQNVSGNSGVVTGITEGEGVDMSTGQGVLRVKRAQYGNEPEMWADELANRYGIEEGDTIGTPEDFPEWLYTGIRDCDGGTGFGKTTNVSQGETTTVAAVACSHAETREIVVEATIGDDGICKERLEVNGWVSFPVEVAPEGATSNTLKIIFKENDEVIDNRYLKIFCD